MLRISLKIVVILALGYCITACSSGNNEEQLVAIEQLKERIKQDSLFRANWARESRAIDSLLTAASGMTSNAQKLGNNLEDKAVHVQEIVEQANERIAQLEKEVKVQKGKAKKMPNLIQNLQKQKQLLLEQDSLIKSLKQQVKKSEVEIAQLTTEVDLKGKTISEQETAINQKIAELNEKEQALVAKQRELEEVKKASTAMLKKQRNSFYVSAGKELITTVKLAPGMAPKKKEKLLGQAWDYICKAYQEGDFNAKTHLQVLQSDRKLGKFVRDKSCN